MASNEEVTDLRLRAQHLFALCDKEEKGFVTKRDMQRMKNEMPLEPEQLELVFDSLDLDGNGFLTFDEFIQGFGIYLEEDEVKQDPTPSKSTDEIKEDEEADEEEFMNLLEGLGGKKVFEEEETVKELWNHLRQDDPDATFQFEKLLEKLSNKIHIKDQEKVSMEEFIRNQNETREEQMRRLYEEMDQQIKQEKELTLQTERLRETQLKIELRAALEKKDRELESLQAREKELLERLNRLEESESSSKQEVAVLLKEKKRLENQLELQSRNVDDLQSSLKKTRQDSVKERRERAMAAFSVSESIAMEREGLVEQLNMLRSINTRLTDESDLRDLSDGGVHDDEDGLRNSIARQLLEIEEDENDDDNEPLNINNADVHLKEISDLMIQNRRCPIKTELSTESNVSSLFDELASALDPSASFDDQEQDTLPIMTKAARPVRKITTNNNNNSNRVRGFKLPSPVYESKVSIPIRPASVQPESWTTVTQGNHVVTWIVQSSIPGEKVAAEDNGSAESDWISAVNKENCVAAILDGSSSADSMIGYHNNRWTNQVHLRKREPITPSTVFKIIVIGDAGCGKTSFIRRFCCDDFIGPESSSTVGIDLSVRCVSVGNDQQVALQFWDTAGKRIRQEKYRSITKQYLRKADGIIIMYDVTSEESFINVRHWMESIKEVVEEDVVRVLVGNKMDLLDLPSNGEESDENKVLNRRSRQVPTATGLQLSEESGGNFFETSAKTGYMIHQCVVAMAAKLQVRQDCIMEKVLLGLAGADPNKADGGEDLRVGDDEKSKKCCNA